MDNETRPDRVKRALWISDLGQPEDGWVSYDASHTAIFAWEEMRFTYVEGCFLTSILAGQVFPLKPTERVGGDS
jgi:hypothetical protein